MKFDGVLFFPVTPFTAEDGTLTWTCSRSTSASRLPFGPGGVFPACGTGEFHALSIDEVRTVVTAAVEVVAGRFPWFPVPAVRWATPSPPPRLPRKPAPTPSWCCRPTW